MKSTSVALKLQSRFLLLATMAAALAPGALDAATADEPATAASAVLGDHYPPRTIAFPGGVTGLADLVYASLDGFRPLTLDIYLPPQSAKKPRRSHPLVIFVHGGGWTNGHSRQSGAFENWPRVLASLASRGYVVSSLNYRLSREAAFPAAEQDVKSAVQWLRAHADEYSIDKTRVLVWGGSAGGQLAALTATSCGIAALEPAPGASSAESDCVQAAIIWYGVFDFSSINGQQAANAPPPTANTAAASATDARQSNNPMTRYLGCDPSNCSPETLRLASAISFVGKNSPPMLLVHGSEDRVVPFAQSQEFYDAMKGAGAVVTLEPQAGVGHSFVGKTAEQTRAASLAALRESFEFIDATIGK